MFLVFFYSHKSHKLLRCKFIPLNIFFFFFFPLTYSFALNDDDDKESNLLSHNKINKLFSMQFTSNHTTRTLHSSYICLFPCDKVNFWFIFPNSSSLLFFVLFWKKTQKCNNNKKRLKTDCLWSSNFAAAAKLNANIDKIKELILCNAIYISVYVKKIKKESLYSSICSFIPSRSSSLELHLLYN